MHFGNGINQSVLIDFLKKLINENRIFEFRKKSIIDLKKKITNKIINT